MHQRRSRATSVPRARGNTTMAEAAKLANFRQESFRLSAWVCARGSNDEAHSADMVAGMTKRCINHPERDASWVCSKHSVAYCDECCRCPYPEGYCTFRPQCAIWQVCLASTALAAAPPRPDETSQRT